MLEKPLSNRIERQLKKIQRLVGKCISDHNLIEAGDRVMVAVSGGKDSITLLYVLLELKKRAPVNFDVFAYTLDQAQPGFDSTELEALYKSLAVEYYIEKQDTYSIVLDKIPAHKTFCSLCSRLRRGILYTKSAEYRATKIALGHHANDAAETLLLNLLYGGRLAAMAPKLIAKEGAHEVIRPLMYVEERDMALFARQMKFPIIPCNLCGNQENLQRKRIKLWLESEKKNNPNLMASIKSALANVQPDFLWVRKFP